MSNPHQIRTLKFDLEIPSIEKNHEIQNQVIDVFNSQFTSMLNEVFNVYSDDKDITINSITLQLDPIQFGHLKKDFVQQCREQPVQQPGRRWWRTTSG